MAEATEGTKPELPLVHSLVSGSHLRFELSSFVFIYIMAIINKPFIFRDIMGLTDPEIFVYLFSIT